MRIVNNYKKKVFAPGDFTNFYLKKQLVGNRHNKVTVFSWHYLILNNIIKNRLSPTINTEIPLRSMSL